MAAALPLAKLGSLLIKTLAKPLSKRIKHDFSRFPITQRLLINVGQATHQLTSRLTIWSAGYRVRSIKPLDEDKALKDGAEMLGETFLLGVSGGIVIWEYQRSREKDRAKQEKAQAEATQERQALQAKLHALNVRLQALETAVQANRESLFRLPGAVYQPPPAEELVPIEDDEPPNANHVLAARSAETADGAAEVADDETPSGVLSRVGSWIRKILP